MKKVLAMLLLILAAPLDYADPKAHAGPPTATILRPWEVPIGSLGFPLGSYLTLEGKRADGMKTGIETLLIDRINGKRLDHPIGIWVDNMDLPPAQFRCILKGYETVRMLGTPPAVEQAAREAGKDISLPQAAGDATLLRGPLGCCSQGCSHKEQANRRDPIRAARRLDHTKGGREQLSV